MGDSRHVWVSLPYATFDIEVQDGKVIDAAPIGHWMIGKDTKMVREWIHKKGGKAIARGELKVHDKQRFNTD